MEDQLSELEACRICVKCYRIAEMDFLALFQDNEEFQKELDFIKGEIKQWKLKIEQDDGLPQRICADCFAKFCSIESFRKECEAAQEKLLQSILNADKEEQQNQNHPMLNSTPVNDVILSDYQVFEPQFESFDNSPTPLMDSSATLLDNNLITTETDGNDMGFLPSSQNLFTFESTEPPTTGTLPLDTETENENPTIMDELMDVQSAVDAGNSSREEDKPDLEDILRSSIIPTTSQHHITLMASVKTPSLNVTTFQIHVMPIIQSKLITNKQNTNVKREVEVKNKYKVKRNWKFVVIALNGHRMEDQLSELEACRICVKCYRIAEMDFLALFQDNEEFQKELDFIKGEIKQWKLKIEQDDGLPQRICADCFAKFCSIESFRKECEAAQEKLLQSILNADKEEQQNQNHPMLNSTPVNDVILSDYQVFEPQFESFDNSPTPLMDSSATLLDNNLITTETDGNDMGFLPSSQNLFTFESTEPPTTGTLPLDTETENENPTIMDELMDVQSAVDAGNSSREEDKPDLEDILRSSIIPTTSQHHQQQQQKRAKLTIVTTRTTPTRTNVLNIVGGNTKTDVNRTGKAATAMATRKTSPMNSSEDATNTSDNECDDANINKRLEGLQYTCHYCYCPDEGPIDHLIFANEDALSQHFFDIHDPNRPYTCQHCNNSYKTQRLRDNHVRLNHEQNTSKCTFCHKNLRGTIDMHQSHCQYIGDWECDVCKEKFYNIPLHRFRLHQRQHDRGRNLKCSVCHRSFMRKANLDAHEKMHKNLIKSQWHCSPCKINFLTNYDLRRHNYQHHDDETPVKCKECNQGFSSIAFMQRHISQIHNNNNNNYNSKPINTTASTSQASSASNTHLCLKCNVSFSTLDSLQWHMELSNKNNGQCLSPDIVLDSKERRRIQKQGVFPCFVCPKRFHLRSQLDKHLNTHDARLRPYQCEQCYIRCRTALELKQHVDVAHLNIKAYPCEKCGKSFGYKKDLSHHMLFHAEINVHCTEDGCEYVCKNEKALNDHIRHKHRLLPCEYCREEFTRQKLTVHLRNVHRTEIDIDLAGNADNFYKSKLLNNNNDITQISFNLLNTQNTKSSPSSSTTTTISSSNAITNDGGGGVGISFSSASTHHHSPAKTTTISSNINMITTSSAGTTSPLSSPNSSHRHVFITDHNSNNLTLNGFIANTSNDLNLTVNPADSSNSMYVVTTATETPVTSSINESDNNLDQYFMASLMDTEQEITVT
ncbi:uncharacterized protein [Musca autumnalis]|uniref:uncharacterized protein n=1 Tax=Musca autumnalis TaxID=221902 RepID=UPI003CF44C3F